MKTSVLVRGAGGVGAAEGIHQASEEDAFYFHHYPARRGFIYHSVVVVIFFLLAVNSFAIEACALIESALDPL